VTAAVTIDLQAAQSAGYRDRGVARYALDFTRAVVARHPELIEQVALNPRLPPIGGADRLLASVPVTTEPRFTAGGVFHVLSPFELAVPLDELWPRQAARSGKRLVATVYDLIPELFPDIYLRDPGQRRRYRARRELVRAADHVMTLSSSAAADVVAHLGVPANRVTVVGASTSEAFVPPADRNQAQAEAARALPGLTVPFVVYNGAVEPRKNMDGLIEAFALLAPDIRKRWQLVLVCKMDDGARAHYRSRADQLGIGDRLLLTGFVPDHTLALIYQATDLAICPSLYEGFGYPVAEATACGAPAIASDTSSLVELVAPGATFDPRQPESMAAAIEAALTDPAQRARLDEWSARPAPTWAEVADRAAAVYDDMARGAAPSRWRRRPLLALITPWPPASTGVAVYNEQLVRALSSYADVDVFHDGDGAAGPRPEALPARDRAVGGYEAVVVALGNSEFHAGALRLLRTWDGPMIVHAHDIRLTNLYLHSAARRAVPEGFLAALRAQYPELPAVPLIEGRGGDGSADTAGVYMLREVARRASRLLVTSEFAADVARLDVDPMDGKRVAVWPYAYPPTVERDASQVDPHLICSFGIVNSAKAPDVLIDAVALLHPGLRLAFVGPVAASEAEELRERAAAAGIGAAVTLTGRVDDAEYRRWLGRAGLAVQLRRRSNGESSGGVADCLVHGVPTVVTDIGPQTALGDAALRVAPGLDATALAKVLDAMLADPDGTAALGLRGRRYAGARDFDWAARQLFELLPELPRS
jgi:glycosyltransferase involved in cell wall biosynthesis